MSDVVVRYLSHPPSLKPTCSILLVGMEGIGKGIIASSIVNVLADFNIFCFTATTKELIKETADKSRIDYIVFMVDTSRKASLDSVKEILEYVDVQYFLGRACFLAPRKASETSYEDEGLLDLAARYSSPAVFVHVGVESDVTACAEGIVRMAGVAAGMTSGVSSLLLA